MKVSGPTGPQRVSGTSKTKKSSGSASGFSSLLDAASGDSSVSSSGATGQAAPVEGILAIQEVETATESPKKAVQRAEDILEQLEEMRIAILSGSLSEAQLQRLAQTLQNNKEQVNDPDLLEVLEQVDLRAQIELAKRGMTS